MQFGQFAKEWWDAKGPMGALHALEEARLSFIKEISCGHFARPPHERAPFQGLAALDWGCGGGLVSEPLARLGFRVTGVDVSPEVLDAACQRALHQELPILYQPPPLEEGTFYDLVLALEVIEHVPDPYEFLKQVSSHVRPQGLFILSTLNRTALSYVLGIVAAEHILKWVPKGAHEWHKFLKPSEIEEMMASLGFHITSIKGFSYSIRRKKWSLSNNLGVNYILSFKKD